MKRLVESEDAGFVSMLGKKICLFCGIYIYTGVVSGVNDSHIELEEPQIVYETGKLKEGDWEDSQSLPSPWNVMIQGIESWGPAKC
jgi:hypothetical protein